MKRKECLTISDKVLLLSEENKIRTATQSYYENPHMTSYASPSEEAGQSSARGADYYGWRAFDGSLSYGWSSSGGRDKDDAWLTYKFDEVREIDTYTIYAKNTTEMPKEFRFEASIDGEDWDVLDTQNLSLSNWLINDWNEFRLPSSKTKKYKVYRLFVMVNNGGAYTTIPEMKLSRTKSYVTQLPGKEVVSFINYGMSPHDLSQLNFSSNFTEKQYIQDKPTPLGVGKVFEQPLDIDSIIKSIKIT